MAAESMSSVSAAPAAAAPPLAISAPPPQPVKSSARPGSSTLPLNFASSPEASSFRPPDAVSEPPALQASSAPAGAISDRSSPPELEGEAEQGPPSAPRLRETSDEVGIAGEREIDEEEPQLKTPPPESGKQHVTPGPTATASEPDEDISITVTMEESEVPPSVESEPPAAAAAPMSASARAEIPEVSGPQPRLALVSEPEIELHGMTPMSSVAEVLPAVIPAKPPAPPEPQRSAPAAAPPTPPAAFAKTAQSVPDTKPSVSVPSEPAEAPPVRLMTQPLADASGKPQPPVEVWASTFAPAALRGQVASFVGQNASFEPKTFGELLRASLALGEEKP